jgi:hypothetical protein
LAAAGAAAATAGAPAGEADDPLLYLERLAYVEALREAVAGLEGARVALARALQRIRDGQGA